MLLVVVITIILIFVCSASIEKGRLFIRDKLKTGTIFDILEKRIISAVHCVELKIMKK